MIAQLRTEEGLPILVVTFHNNLARGSGSEKL
jgi:hypothetical protein